MRATNESYALKMNIIVILSIQITLEVAIAEALLVNELKLWKVQAKITSLYN